jgi:hypothetical protein
MCSSYVSARLLVLLLTGSNRKRVRADLLLLCESSRPVVAGEGDNGRDCLAG